ncbi:hypothetical protein PR202_ga14571 [Eleusine coracana subsp. coracana]|uniref:Regulator of Vps4 activity in the MVB pathway protein n=1 Tax=Eleusine coracana subsp. coracana TaxID=191504 RepID=A0AAV5CHS0_ELECO|nr:hypothetical protein PR202_ga14571 [Eleusine coracana subsp. coracana]
MGPIRRKKHAMIRFLKKDVADLLANGLDTHAFGRMDGLIVELNHSACYDMIEQFCDEIGKQLGSLQKQRECPPETREAVSTLIYAAARFPDLPELCDIRHLFTERYDSFVEHFVSLEFVQKLESKEFTNEEKMQVIKSIAEELSVSFDAKKLELKLWATSETEHDMLGKGLRKQVESAMPSSNKQKCDEDASSEIKEKDIIEKINSANAQAVPDGIGRSDENSKKHQSAKSYDKEHLEKPVSSGDTKRRHTPKDVKKVTRRDNRPSEKELMEAVELDLDDRFNAKPKESVKEHHVEKENKEAFRYCHRSRMPGGLDDDGRHTESNLRARDLENKGRPVTPPNGNTRNKVPPYAKQNGANMKNHIEKQANNGFLHDRPVNGAEGRPVTPPNGNTRNKVPPYAKQNGANMKNHTEKQANNGFLHDRPVNGAEGRPVTPPNGNTRNKVPPYAKQNGANMKNHIEKQANNGFLHDRPQHLVDLEQLMQQVQGVTSFLNDRPQHLVDRGHPVQNVPGMTERPAKMTPPYVKPKFNVQTVNGEPEKRTPEGCSNHNIPGQAEQLADKDVLRPFSVRKRNAKSPAAVDYCGEVPNKEKVTSETPSSHRRHSSRKNAADPDHNGNETDGVVGIGKNIQRTPSSQPKHTGRRNGALSHKKDYDGFMRRRQPEEESTAIDFGNLLPRHASAQRRHRSGCVGDLDDEERMMDKLLMHYSKKGLDPTNKTANDSEARTDSPQRVVSLHPPGRAISLPPVSAGPGENVKVPARTTSLQPDCPSTVRVHPRMPDFDELAARVNALKNA